MKTERLNIALMAIVPLFVFCGVVAFSAEIEKSSQKSSEVVGQAFRELLQNSMQEERLLPILTNGEVSAAQPRSAKLLEYIIEDYTYRNLERGRAIHYSALAGVTDIKTTASCVGQFKAANKATASYFMTIGNKIAAAELAIVLITVEVADGIHETKSVVYWDNKLEKWRLLQSVGPSMSPVTVQTIE